MSNPSSDRKRIVFDAMISFPDTLCTAKQVAAATGWKALKASHDMGAMYFQGLLDRRAMKKDEGREFIYWIKPPKAPTPVAWDGPVLMAASRIRDRETV